MSDSDEEYGPPLPPGLSKPASSSDSDKDQSGQQSPKCSSSSSAPRTCAVQPSHLANTSNYTSDSDADSDNSDAEDVQSDTKKSLHKQNKTSASGIGPVLPPHLQHLAKATAQTSSDDDDGDVGPRLPPHLLQAARSHSSHTTRVVRDNDSSDEGDIGPSVSLQASSDDHSALRDFEIRAQKMKDRLEGKEEVEDPGPQKRESWMTELPSALNKQYAVLENRQFRKNAAPEQDASWTETPQEKERREKEAGSEGKKRKHNEGNMPTEEDLKAATEIEKFNKKNRSKTLLEMHQKELKKKKKKEKKKNKDKAKERRPFDRDVDLQVNKLDDARRKAIIKRSQELSSRFKTGGTGTSFL